MWQGHRQTLSIFSTVNNIVLFSIVQVSDYLLYIIENSTCIDGELVLCLPTDKAYNEKREKDNTYIHNVCASNKIA